MMLTYQRGYITSLPICLVTIVVIVCNFTITSAAAFHASKKQINAKATERDSNNIEALDQQSLTTYDQRQSGKYNINVSVKDVKIIYGNRDEFQGSLDDDTIYDYGDYDYDPSHLTVSPLPIFGIGSASLNSRKPPKSLTNIPTSTYVTKLTTDKPHPTTIIDPPATSNLIISTAGIHEPSLKATKPIAQKQLLETHTSSSILSSTAVSSLFAEENYLTSDKTKTAAKTSDIANTVIVQPMVTTTKQ